MISVERACSDAACGLSNRAGEFQCSEVRKVATYPNKVVWIWSLIEILFCFHLLENKENSRTFFVLLLRSILKLSIVIIQ